MEAEEEIRVRYPFLPKKCFTCGSTETSVEDPDSVPLRLERRVWIRFVLKAGSSPWSPLSACQCCRFSLLPLGSGPAQESRILIRTKVSRTRNTVGYLGLGPNPDSSKSVDPDQDSIQTNSDPKDCNTRTSFYDSTPFLKLDQTVMERHLHS
jgi:hypothetical protein